MGYNRHRLRQVSRPVSLFKLSILEENFETLLFLCSWGNLPIIFRFVGDRGRTQAILFIDRFVRMSVIFALWVLHRREGLNRFSLKTCELWLYRCWRHSRHFFVLIIFFFFSNPMAGFYSTSYLWYCAIGWFVTMLIGTVTSLLLGERQIKQVWVVCVNLVPRAFPKVPAFETSRANVVLSMTGKKLKYIKNWVNDLFSVCFWACLFVKGHFIVVCLVAKPLKLTMLW